MIDRRRMPMTSGPEAMIPLSSGPRWVIASHIAATVARADGLEPHVSRSFPRRSSCPAIPHITCECFLRCGSGGGGDAPAPEELHAHVQHVVGSRELACEVRERVVAGDEG